MTRANAPRQFILNYGNYGNGYANMEMGVDAGSRGGTGRFGIHGGSSRGSADRGVKGVFDPPPSIFLPPPIRFY